MSYRAKKRLQTQTWRKERDKLESSQAREARLAADKERARVYREYNLSSARRERLAKAMDALVVVELSEMLADASSTGTTRPGAPNAPRRLGLRSTALPKEPDPLFSDSVRRERVWHNAVILDRDGDSRWPNHGTVRFKVDSREARKFLGAVSAERDAGGHFYIGNVRFGGFANYHATHAIEAGLKHSEEEQQRHTIVLTRELMPTALTLLPGLRRLVDDVGSKVRQQGHAPPLELLHAHVLDQSSAFSSFGYHQDTEEEIDSRKHKPDIRVVFTAVIALSDTNNTKHSAMRILGCAPVQYEDGAGSTVMFASALWHRTVQSELNGVWKLAVFYGYVL